MSISNTNANSSFFLSPNQVNSAAANGSIQPGQMVLVPASMFQSGQVDTTQFQPVGNYDPNMIYAQGGVQQGGQYYYGGNGQYQQYQNPFNNGLPMGTSPVQGPNGSPILGGQIEPTLPGNTTTTPTTGTGQGTASQMLGQMVQMMISMLTQIMAMLQNNGATAGDVTDDGNAEQGQNNDNGGGGCHKGGGQAAAQDVSAASDTTGTKGTHGSHKSKGSNKQAALDATGDDAEGAGAAKGSHKGAGKGKQAAFDEEGGDDDIQAQGNAGGGGGCGG